jgi:hypothetical protein
MYIYTHTHSYIYIYTHIYMQICPATGTHLPGAQNASICPFIQRYCGGDLSTLPVLVGGTKPTPDCLIPKEDLRACGWSFLCVYPYEFVLFTLYTCVCVCLSIYIHWHMNTHLCGCIYRPHIFLHVCVCVCMKICMLVLCLRMCIYSCHIYSYLLVHILVSIGLSVHVVLGQVCM